MEDRILTVGNKKEEKALREPTRELVPLGGGTFAAGGETLGRKELGRLVNRMRQAMNRANGIGLAANQLGLPYRMFVAQVPDSKGGQKFYAVLNPRLERTSGEKTPEEEGCLSVPGLYGEVERHAQVTLRGLDKSGKVLKIKAWGLLARVFQHEVDHLEGKLFVDKAKKLYERPRSERLKERGQKPKGEK